MVQYEVISVNRRSRQTLSPHLGLLGCGRQAAQSPCRALMLERPDARGRLLTLAERLHGVFLMRRDLLLAALVWMTASTIGLCQDATLVHRIDVKTPEELRKLFRFDGARMPLLSAHRGGAVPGYPESCLATFEHTLSHTFSILEIDLRLTKDGQIVLLHDATLDRTTTGTGLVAEQDLDELKRLRLKDNDGIVTNYGIPTLDEVLEWARGTTVVILDKKDVPVETCVRKIQEHGAQAYAMVMAYSFDEVVSCDRLDSQVMMEVMIGSEDRLRGFDATGIPWDHVVAFVGHAPPNDRHLLQQLHARGVCCMAGTSRNLDRQLSGADMSQQANLRGAYQDRLEFGIDLIETDLPVQVNTLLYDPPHIPAAKSRFFQLPKRTGNLK